MKELLDKIGSYNIFNYLLPGALFAAFIDWATPIKLLQVNAVVGMFLYYFLGSVVSRIGSLLVDPVLLRFGLIAFEPYENFVRASKLDPKLEVLSETNNMYRTICALMVSISGVGAYEFSARYVNVLHEICPIVVVGGLLLLYIASYRKQTAYIKKRITANLQQ